MYDDDADDAGSDGRPESTTATMPGRARELLARVPRGRAAA